MQEDDDFLIHQFLVVSRFFVKTLNSQIADYGCYSSEWSILNFLSHRDGILQTELAGSLQVELAAVSKTCKKLEEKELICRLSKEDRREKYIYLTEKGKEHHRQVAAAAAAHRRAVLAGLAEQDKQAMLSMLKKISSNLHQLQGK